MDFEKYITLGKESGLKGDALIEFAREREKIARDERQKEREHQKEMKEYDLKIASTGSNLADSKGGLGNTAPTKLPKLPLFKEGTDDMDAFILRFERFATAANWPRTIWATSMGALLTGRALEVYSRMWTQDSNDRHFSYLVYRFVMLRGRTLLFLEQMINSSRKELAVFLKERTPDKASDMALLADKYREAHGNYDKGKRNQSFKDRTRDKNENDKDGVAKSTGEDRPSYKKVRESRTCFVCGKSGHIAKDCWDRAGDRAKRSIDKVASVGCDSPRDDGEQTGAKDDQTHIDFDISDDQGRDHVPENAEYYEYGITDHPNPNYTDVSPCDRFPSRDLLLPHLHHQDNATRGCIH
ncbi:hypothetical protein HOLleu_32690 [Holothuria leucospilota]|uniref:CCHC-type domain-containing protein n=1 Tax=Holothuria leucospilota TaxID=206669 RepID=A0A9Q1GZ84_HOLLE|nr:hypothetical protein HOLleu_32690 [Holothuria leucospilota]